MIEKNIRKATWNIKALKNKSKERDSKFWKYFPPAKPKELLREEKGRLTDDGHNTWWHMKCAQCAEHNKFGPETQNTLVKTSNVLGSDWSWHLRTYLTSKSKFHYALFHHQRKYTTTTGVPDYICNSHDTLACFTVSINSQSPSSAHNYIP